MDLFTTTIVNEQGEPVPGASVYVYETRSATLAALFLDDETSDAGNPLITDQYGFASARAANGQYDVQVKKNGLLLKGDGLNGFELYDPSESPETITDGSLELVKLEEIDDMMVVGNVTGSTAVPSLVEILDEDDMASDSPISLATQRSIKAYIDAQVSALNVPTQFIKAFGTFDGTGGTGSKAINGFGCTVTKSSDGVYAVTFDTPLANANYTVVTGGMDGTSDFFGVDLISKSKMTTGFALKMGTYAGSPTSGTNINFLVLAT